MSLAPQPAASRFRERCRCVVRLETSREGCWTGGFGALRLTLERGGGGGAGVVAGMVLVLLCCSAFTRQPPQVAAAALYKLLYRLPHHSAMSLAPQPAALRFRERYRSGIGRKAPRVSLGLYRKPEFPGLQKGKKNASLAFCGRADRPVTCLLSLRCHPTGRVGNTRNSRKKPEHCMRPVCQ